MIWMISCNTNVRVVELILVKLAIDSVGTRSVLQMISCGWIT